APDEVELTLYDFLTFNIKIDSNRDEVADDTTPLVVNFVSHDGVRQDMSVDLGDRQRTWVPVRIAIPDLIRKSAREPAAWRRLKLLQLVVAESNYRDRTRLEFEIDRIELVKVRQPLILEIDSTDVILLPAPSLRVGASGLGMAAVAGGYRLSVKLCDASGATVAARDAGLAGDAKVTLDLPVSMKCGPCTLVASILDAAGHAVSVERKPIEAIPGPLAGP
ncbi:MAG: hypothetical protein KJ579_05720, partial [Verrucomicrobia bacterium]|nr:hypothetical protein [Verrucomicrobiota bacterium]